MLTRHIVSLALMPMLAVSAPAAAAPAQPGAPAASTRVYIGTGAQNIYKLNLDTATGRITTAENAAEAVRPTFLALHPTQPVLYAVEAVEDGAVTALRIEAESGNLTVLVRRSSGGPGPCHVAVAPSGDYVAVANYSGGSIALFRLKDDGTFGEGGGFSQHEGSSANPQRQEGPHAHSVTFDPAGRVLLAADLGVDKVFLYRFGEGDQGLTANDPAFAVIEPGAGPRHVSFHPSARFVYVVNELSSTISAFTYDADAGRLDPLQSISTLPAGFNEENTTAEIRVHPSGRFLYASNRGHDSIALFAIDGASGRLAAAGHTPCGGKTPRNFNIDPSGRFMLTANQDSNNVAVLTIDAETGALASTDQSVEVPAPMCVTFVTP